MIELFPAGFEELEREDGVELVAYTDASGEERLWQAFGAVRGVEVPDGWEDQWRRFHRPIRVGGLWVGPPWESPEGDALAVVIDPGRAFGTGSHPTTRLCLELLAEQRRCSVLDVGCGSGVLAIAALRLGFEPVIAVDVEEPAVAATVANAERNGVALSALLVDALVEPLPTAELVLANVTLPAVETIAARVGLATTRLITSGYLASDVPAVHGWRSSDRRATEGWAADLWEKT
jgi:ribosomal protein L11 methyltransferase